MVSARALLLAATCCCAYLWLARAEDSSLETRSLDFPLKTQQEKDLIDALQEVLEKLRSKEMPLEKKLGWLPSVCVIHYKKIYVKIEEYLEM
ncbi:hypothetical protein PFLUV_G00231450 [Perca fluviatilis]|uniref:Cocaine- and amphetamine-regulated transcript protein n=1 Tax=Perca fluviatilis TaxID=8168 RepID=A0A6A5EF26_PERFL|nr:hypothetical protein PFLUV_G00231450 [Perca fluviatilis]